MEIEELTLLPTAESRVRDGSDIADPSLVSEGSVTPDEDSSLDNTVRPYCPVLSMIPGRRLEFLYA